MGRINEDAPAVSSELRRTCTPLSSVIRRDARIIAGHIACILVLLTAACTSEPQRRDRFFVLEAQALGSPPASRQSAATLVVQDLATRGFLGGRQIVYRTRQEPLELRRYTLYLWEQPPARALTRNLVGSLRGAGLFHHVAGGSEQARPDYRLSGELIRFEHRPTDPTPRVLGEVTLSLVSMTDRSIPWSRTYADEEAVSGDRPEDMAAAFNRLSNRIIARVIQDLAAAKPMLAPAGTR